MPTDLSVERDALQLLEEVLDLPETMRESFLARQPVAAEVVARVRSMLEAERLVSLRTGTAVLGLGSGPHPERIGPYRVTGLVGRGGMGAVYRAERDAGDFAREVAIKLVKPGLLSEELQERLAAERQVLAGLVHPNIARLYDGGTTEAGQPYIVMELVDGAPIDRFAEGEGLGEEARIRLVEALADAIAHAHRRLVIHRDITPLNVLVTREGVPKLIDFGIARAAGQATTAVDIGGLGRLLKRLLPDAGPELAAIIAKATDADEARRYPTAEALAEDLRRYRSGEAVAAYAGGRAYWLRKFVARHRLAVAASFAGALLLAGAFAAVLAANAEARRAEAEAEARFEQTRGIARALLFDVYDAVSRVPGATLAREKLAEVAVTYLDALAGLPRASEDVVAEAGRGYVRLAEVVGGGQHASLGRYEDANGLFARAEALLVPAWEANRQDEALTLAFAQLRIRQAGTNIYNNGAFALARAQAEEAARATAPFARRNREAARIHAVALQAIGDTYGWSDETEQSRDAFLAAIAFIESLPQPLRTDPDVRGAESAILRLLGEAHHLLDESDAARQVLARATVINRDLVRIAPGDPQNRRKLSISLWYSAVVDRATGRTAEARRAIAESLEVARAIVADDPNDRGGLGMIATAGEVAAQLAADARDGPASRAHGEEVLAVHDQLVALAGDAPGAMRARASAQRTLAGNHERLGERAAACAMWRRALASYEEIDRRGALSDYDRNNPLPEGRAFIATNC
jgi:tRNA A-37 threonylcarbamoyl transferase component Bud32